MEKILVKLYIASESLHIHQPIVGFLELEKKGILECRFVKKHNIEFPNDHCSQAEIKDKSIVFDMADGYNFNNIDLNNFLDKIDFYFKRSFSVEENYRYFMDKNLNKIYPYGFNYYISDKRIPISLKSSFKRKMIYFYHLINGIEDDFSIPKKEDFICSPIENISTPKIVFCTRLWDEYNIYEKKVLDSINDTRIEIIKLLKKKYGKDFFGGVQNSELARKKCKEIILPSGIYKRSNYLEIMKNADICIGSTGLHNSIGWKTGEYVAAAKAIVNEKFNYLVPGNFEENKNYLSYSSVSECIKEVDKLFNDIELIKKMSKNNYDYYKNNLDPIKLIENALIIAKIM